MSKQPVDYPSIRWPQRAGIWLGIGLNPASISTGGGIAMLMPFPHLLWVLPAGALLLLLISINQGLLGLLGRERRGRAFSACSWRLG